MILSEPRERDTPDAAAAREAFSRERYDEGTRLLPPGQDIERAVAARLAVKPGDPVHGLRGAPIGLRRLYTQAYQSYLFNRTLSLAIGRGLGISGPEAGDNWGDLSPDGLVLTKVHGVREPLAGGAVPLVQLAGYAYRNYGSRFDRCLESVMEEEGVSAKEFYVEEMQEVSVEGGFRRPHMTAKDTSCAVEGKTARLGFTLARGEYATVLVREIVKPDDPEAQGFA